ncbi:hypothetical protein L6164_034416 [Bauhinia variegata]|uniref:Uncharacterized protein n=1 Tax=Bauhinia variegata TaxID=167791 RepID=A0ACB9KUR7_BAUVA|nr:hypothetical protein L6164_034416 [Bauhinia variegata]
MGRAPCCEKMGLKKGPWTPEEDLILINYINANGHNNWRALPKQAGLLRCGKSCRLRWTNYLRPDIKRGNFTGEEEDTIIRLHQMLGNRWSAIAARLPGRTDNEIKNVWHTHLKKRLPQYQQNQDKRRTPKQIASSNPSSNQDTEKEQDLVSVSLPSHVKNENTENRPLSPPQCSSSDISTLTTSDNIDHNSTTAPTENVPSLDVDFWSEVLSADNSGETSDLPAIFSDQQFFRFPLSSLVTSELESATSSSSSSMCDGMDFWYNIYTRAGESAELPGFDLDYAHS